MTLGIGNKYRLSPNTENRTPRTEHREPRRGFTLVEVMVAAAVLSLGLVLVYQALFTSLNGFNYCVNYLAVSPWMGQKLWQAQEDLTDYGKLTATAQAGNFITGNRVFDWNLYVNPLDESRNFNLYKINLELFWQEGAKRMRLFRQAYALYKKE